MTERDRHWRDRAACLGIVVTVDWVPANEAITKTDKELARASVFCRACPVRIECLRFALRTGAQGYWAGTSTYQRKQISRVRGRTKCPTCLGDELVAIDERDEDPKELCLGCGMSWTSGRRPKDKTEESPQKPRSPLQKDKPVVDIPDVLAGLL